MSAARVRRLTLSNLRSYRAASVAVDAQLVVLVGPNGAGKTNLIEAISFLAPGRGLRRATLDDVAFTEGDGSWAAAAELEGVLGLATLGTGIEPPSSEDATLARKCRVDGETVPSAASSAPQASARPVPAASTPGVPNRQARRQAVRDSSRSRDRTNRRRTTPKLGGAPFHGHPRTPPNPTLRAPPPTGDGRGRRRR